MSIVKWAAAAAVVLAACAPAAPEADGAQVIAPKRGEPLRLSSPRAVHASVVLGDGRVVLIGGCSARSCDPGPGSSTADLVDPRTGAVVGTGRLTGPRIGASAVRLKGDRVLILGGWDGASPTAGAEIYDPKTGTSRRVGPMNAARADASVAELGDGTILIAGGFDGSGRLSSAELFDPLSESFILLRRSMAEARSGAATVRLSDGRVLLAGGTTGSAAAAGVTAAAELFDPGSLAFSRTGDLAEARHKHAAVLLGNGQVLVVAGSDQSDYRGKKDSFELYDPASGRFRSGGRLRTPRFKLAGAVVRLADGRILIAGGARRPEVYDPATGTTVQLDADLGESWSFMSADLLADGRVLLAGGYSEGRIETTDRIWLLEIPPQKPDRKAARLAPSASTA
jgi:hypothetical protein